jgi:hypothetical protein
MPNLKGRTTFSVADLAEWEEDEYLFGETGLETGLDDGSALKPISTRLSGEWGDASDQASWDAQPPRIRRSLAGRLSGLDIDDDDDNDHTDGNSSTVDGDSHLTTSSVVDFQGPSDASQPAASSSSSSSSSSSHSPRNSSGSNSNGNRNNSGVGDLDSNEWPSVLKTLAELGCPAPRPTENTEGASAAVRIVRDSLADESPVLLATTGSSSEASEAAHKRGSVTRLVETTVAPKIDSCASADSRVAEAEIAVYCASESVRAVQNKSTRDRNQLVSSTEAIALSVGTVAATLVSAANAATINEANAELSEAERLREVHEGLKSSVEVDDSSALRASSEVYASDLETIDREATARSESAQARINTNLQERRHHAAALAKTWKAEESAVLDARGADSKQREKRHMKEATRLHRELEAALEELRSAESARESALEALADSERHAEETKSAMIQLLKVEHAVAASEAEAAHTAAATSVRAQIAEAVARKESVDAERDAAEMKKAELTLAPQLQAMRDEMNALVARNATLEAEKSALQAELVSARTLVVVANHNTSPTTSTTTTISSSSATNAAETRAALVQATNFDMGGDSDTVSTDSAIDEHDTNTATTTAMAMATTTSVQRQSAHSDQHEVVEPVAAVVVAPVSHRLSARSDSMSSLVSVAPGNCTSRDTVSGLIRVTVRYDHHASKRSAGVLRVTVHEAMNLQTSQPYVKIYMSRRGVDFKQSKRKTKNRKGNNPVFGDEFEFLVASERELEEDRRLQISVWDHARLKANECTGGLSFSLLEIASTSVCEGWFKLLPTSQGRERHERWGGDRNSSSSTASMASDDGQSPSDVEGDANRSSNSDDNNGDCADDSDGVLSTEASALVAERSAALTSPTITSPTTSATTIDNGSAPFHTPWASDLKSATPMTSTTAASDDTAASDVGANPTSPQGQQQQQQQPQQQQQQQPTVDSALVQQLATERAELDAALSERTQELWHLMEKNAAHVSKLAEVLEENVNMRHESLDTAGIRLRTGVIIKPSGGSLGLEIGNDVNARYTGVRISHVTEYGPADGGQIRSGDVIVAINGDLVLGMDFDEVIRSLTDAGSVIVLSLASGKEVDAPGSPFWDEAIPTALPTTVGSSNLRNSYSAVDNGDYEEEFL